MPGDCQDATESFDFVLSKESGNFFSKIRGGPLPKIIHGQEVEDLDPAEPP
jgi:hypothetical protein